MLAVLTTLFVFSIALASYPRLGDGWFWEIGNALGFVALAGLLIVTLNGRASMGNSPNHRLLGLFTVSVVLAHIIWFLIGDPLTIEYLKFGTPPHMVFAILSIALLMLLSVSSLSTFRDKSFYTRQKFRAWHRWLSLCITLSAIAHITLSGFYLSEPAQWLLLLVVVTLLYVLTFTKLPRYSISKVVTLSSFTLALLCFVLLRYGVAL